MSACDADALCMQPQARYARLSAQHFTSPQPAQPYFFHEMCLASATCVELYTSKKMPLFSTSSTLKEASMSLTWLNELSPNSVQEFSSGQPVQHEFES
jgi:hypothetical protein